MQNLLVMFVTTKGFLFVLQLFFFSTGVGRRVQKQCGKTDPPSSLLFSEEERKRKRRRKKRAKRTRIRARMDNLAQFCVFIN